MVFNDLKWVEATEEQKESKNKICDEIWNMLQEKRYVGEASNESLLALDENFRKELSEYSEYIPDIVRVLTQHFGRALGQSPGDVESYDIDANGNHRQFYTGFNRYALQYTNLTNQIYTLERTEYSHSKRIHSFPMNHDSYGNVVQALHKGIQRIEYHAQSQRTRRIFMTDGQQLKFHYDSLGERVVKQTRNARGEVVQETYYLRDRRGRCLVDIQVTKLGPAVDPDFRVTAYIYGPRNLIGFTRRDTYYSVITDHEGSVRLVVRDGEVVAAYDYLPYGQLLRQYGRDPDAHIAYRYTGQEYDAETGLYNYHARLYDPEIGRFFQVDPKEQYSSPYKYAGNSPVALVDPDGEFAFLIPLALGFIFGYMGGAAANNNWNPVEWDYKSGKTWSGIVVGGLVGGLAPAGAAASITFFMTAFGVGPIAAAVMTAGAGVAFAYVNKAISENDFNPGNWNWTSPSTYNDILNGVATGVSLPGSIAVVKSFYKDLPSPLAKGLFVGGTTVSAGSFAYFNGANTENGWELNPVDWDWKNTETYWSLGNGALTGYTLTQIFTRDPIEGIPNGLDGISSLGSTIAEVHHWRKSGNHIVDGKSRPALRKKMSRARIVFDSTIKPLQEGQNTFNDGLFHELEKHSGMQITKNPTRNPARSTNVNVAEAGIELDIIARGSESASGPEVRNAQSGVRPKGVLYPVAGDSPRRPSDTRTGFVTKPNPSPNGNMLGASKAMGVPYDAKSLSKSGQRQQYAVHDLDVCKDIFESANCIISPSNAWNIVTGLDTLLAVAPQLDAAIKHRLARFTLNETYLGLFNETKDKSMNAFISRIPRDISRENHDVGEEIDTYLNNDRLPTKRYEDLFSPPAKSSASRLLPSFYLSDLGNVLDYMGTLVSTASKPGNPLYPVDSVQAPRTGKKSSRQVVIEDCVPWAVEGGEYVAGITCNAKQSNTFIFQKDSVDPPRKPLEKPEDRFRNCRPIEWHGRPSVTCEGDATTLVHIPDPPRRIFDHVDGWLLLARIAPAVYREAKSLVGFVARGWTNQKDEELVAIGTEQRSTWRRDLEGVDELIATLLPALGEGDLRWAKTMLGERREDVAAMNRKSVASRSDVELTAELLQALREDVEEMAPVDVTDSNVPLHQEDNQETHVHAKNYAYDILPVVDHSYKTLSSYSYVSDKVGHARPHEIGF